MDWWKDDPIPKVGDKPSIAEWLDLYSRIQEYKKWLKTEKTSIEERLDELKHESGPIVSAFVNVGIQNIKINGQTASLTTVTRVNKKADVEMGTICGLMRGTELADFVHPAFSPQSLKSYVIEKLKELEDADDTGPVAPLDALPEKIRDCFNIYRGSQLVLSGTPDKKQGGIADVK